MIIIYILYICSLVEYNCVVWHSSITDEEIDDLERIQKCSMRIILQNRYTTYEEALENFKLETLKIRREKLCLEFGKKCLKSPDLSKWFPLNCQTNYEIRNGEKFEVNFASTERYRMSTIPYLQRLLNSST